MKTSRILILIAALSLAGTVAAYFFLPDSIPVHWNFEGKIDSWGPRWSIIAMGLLPLGTALLMAWLPRIDPRREAYERHAKTYEILQVLIVLILTGIVWITAAAGLGLAVDVSAAIRVMIGLLFLGIGNFLGRLKRNYFVGIKTPWTLADDEVWRRTHRRGAVVFMVIGACFLLSLAFRPGWILGVVTLVPTILGIVYVFAYSWYVWKERHGNEKPVFPSGTQDAAKKEKEKN